MVILERDGSELRGAGPAGAHPTSAAPQAHPAPAPARGGSPFSRLLAAVAAILGPGTAGRRLAAE